jgi:hypothetical protein
LAPRGRKISLSNILREELKTLKPGTPEYVEHVRLILAAQRNEVAALKEHGKARARRDAKGPRQQKKKSTGGPGPNPGLLDMLKSEKEKGDLP